MSTICPRSSYPFYIESNYIKWVTTWTCSFWKENYFLNNMKKSEKKVTLYGAVKEK